VNENINWLEYTYDKLGNQLSIQALGYKKHKVDPSQNAWKSHNGATLYINVTNHGLSDQVHDDIKILINNKNVRVLSNGKQDRVHSLLQTDSDNQSSLDNLETYGKDVLQKSQPKTNYIYLNGLKRRTSSVLEIPVLLVDPRGFAKFYDAYSGSIETNVEYHEFLTSTSPKNEIVSFNLIQ
jgi:hypothetical protein